MTAAGEEESSPPGPRDLNLAGATSTTSGGEESSTPGRSTQTERASTTKPWSPDSWLSCLSCSGRWFALLEPEMGVVIDVESMVGFVVGPRGTDAKFETVV